MEIIKYFKSLYITFTLVLIFLSSIPKSELKNGRNEEQTSSSNGFKHKEIDLLDGDRERKHMEREDEGVLHQDSTLTPTHDKVLLFEDYIGESTQQATLNYIDSSTPLSDSDSGVDYSIDGVISQSSLIGSVSELSLIDDNELSKKFEVGYVSPDLENITPNEGIDTSRLELLNTLDSNEVLLESSMILEKRMEGFKTRAVENDEASNGNGSVVKTAIVLTNGSKDISEEPDVTKCVDSSGDYDPRETRNLEKDVEPCKTNHDSTFASSGSSLHERGPKFAYHIGSLWLSAFTMRILNAIRND